MINDPAILRAAKAYAKQSYDQQVVRQAGAASEDRASAGPPQWSRDAWEAHKAQYGEYPFKATGPLPSTFDGAPDWVYDLMNMRKPPVSVSLGSSGREGGLNPTGAVDNLSIWGMR